MNDDEVFEAWAPRSSRWSPWVKPVLFAWMRDQTMASPWPDLPADWEFTWLPKPHDGAVLVLDLPGAEGVAAGLALAQRGYRPVPLYNAIPTATPFSTGDRYDEAPPVVDVLPIAGALIVTARRLTLEALPDDAPPAFLLDSTRRTGQRPPLAGSFDNRSVSFPTDFPSANFLLAHGIRRAILVQRGATEPAADLAHTLRAWQEAGIVIESKRIDLPGPAMRCEVPKPSRFGKWFYRALTMMGFQRGTLGGFGGVLPELSSGG